MAMQPNRGKGSSNSAAAKRLAEAQAEKGSGRRDSRGNTGFGRGDLGTGRRAKSGLTGFGMTKQGVEQQANSEWRREFMEGFGGETTVDYDKYSDLVKGMSVSGPAVQPYKKTEKDSLAAANRVRSRYGIKQKNQADQDFSLRREANYAEQPQRRAGNIDAEAEIRRYAPGYGSKRFSDRY